MELDINALQVLPVADSRIGLWPCDPWSTCSETCPNTETLVCTICRFATCV
jgi:hypothetical protein